MSNLVQRTLSGAVYVAVIVSAILFSRVAFSVLFGFMTIWAVWEFCHLLKLDSWLKGISMFCGALLYIVYLCDVKYVIPIQVLYGVVLMVALIAELFRKKENPIHNWGYLLVSQVMVALPLSLTQKVLIAGGEWNVGKYVLLAVFACIWLNDSGAYCVGSLIGRHKMFPRVSPGKSWEGLVGGFVFSLVGGFVFSLFVKDYTCWEWLVIAFTVSLFSTFGDLMESLFKRTIGVKDSGKFLPGHGGVLDRLDSILLCTPAMYLLLEIIELLK